MSNLTSHIAMTSRTTEFYLRNLRKENELVITSYMLLDYLLIRFNTITFVIQG